MGCFFVTIKICIKLVISFLIWYKFLYENTLFLHDINMEGGIIMARFPEMLYKKLTNELITEWFRMLKTKVRVSNLTLEYYEAISMLIEERVTALREKGYPFKFFAFAGVEDDSRDFAVLVDNNFDLTIFEFERWDYCITGPKLVTNFTNDLFSASDCTPSWTCFLYENLGYDFITYFIFSKLDTKIIAEYVRYSKIVTGNIKSIVELFDGSDYKVFVFSDSEGYEYRLTVNLTMDCFIMRTHVTVQEVSHRIPYLPTLYSVDGEATLFEFVKDKYLNPVVK